MVSEVQGRIGGAWAVVASPCLILHKQCYEHAPLISRDACKARCLPPLAELRKALPAVAVPRCARFLPAPCGDALHGALHFLIQLRCCSARRRLWRCITVALFKQRVQRGFVQDSEWLFEPGECAFFGIALSPSATCFCVGGLIAFICRLQIRGCLHNMSSANGAALHGRASLSASVRCHILLLWSTFLSLLQLCSFPCATALSHGNAGAFSQ